MAEMQEIESLLTCANNHSNQPILFVLQNKRLPVKQRLYCSQCISDKGGISDAEVFETLRKEIEDKQNELFQNFEGIKSANLQKIQRFKSQIEAVRDEVILKFDSILCKIIDWCRGLDELANQISKFSLLEELDDVHIPFEIKSSRNIQKMVLCNFQFYEKIKKELENLQFIERINKCNSAFLNVFLSEKIVCINKQVQVHQKDEHDTPHLDCVCPHHNKNIIFINIKKGVEKSKRLGCVFCENINFIPIQEFVEEWEKYNSLKVQQYQQLQNKQKEKFNQVIQILENLKYEQFTFFKHFQKMIEHKILFGMSSQSLYTCQMNDVIEMAEELSVQQGQMKCLFTKECQEFKLELYKKSNDLIQNYQRELQKINQGLTTITTELIDQITQNEVCNAISFNSEGTLMVAGCANDIKLWKFDQGVLKCPIILTYHKDLVSCLIFSKKQEWFVSGSYDYSIQCWKELGNNKWGRSQCDIVHQDVVSCILINENEIISGSWDKSIKIWQYNYKDNTLKFQYSLNGHYAIVYGLSLNDRQNLLVSTSGDRQILIWEKIIQRWQFMQSVNKNIIDFGYRVCFLQENVFAWQQARRGITHFFQLEGNNFIQKSHVELNQEEEDDGFFPTIYNKNRNIIIQKHNRFAYIIRKEITGQYEIACEPINCDSDSNIGALTDDGKYLIIWNQVTKQYRIYMINYI